MFVGLLGSVLPGLPGVTLIFPSAFVYALLTDFRTVGAAVLVVLFVRRARLRHRLRRHLIWRPPLWGQQQGTLGGAIGGIVGTPGRTPLPRYRLPIRPHPRHHHASSSANTSSARARTNKGRPAHNPTGVAPRTRQAGSSSATWPPRRHPGTCSGSPASLCSCWPLVVFRGSGIRVTGKWRLCRPEASDALLGFTKDAIWQVSG